MLTLGMIHMLGQDEAILQAANEKGLVVAEHAAFTMLFPGETIGTTREYYARGTRCVVATIGAGVDSNLIWKAKADRS